MAGSNIVQSVQRAIDILEMVADRRDGARLTEIADALDLNKTTAHNLLRTLRTRGFLTKDTANRIQIGPKIEEISRHHYRRSIFQRAEAGMRRLHMLMPGATVTFSELVGSEIVCRLRMAADLPGVLRRPQAQTFCPFGSASGLCLQAFNHSYRENLAATKVFEESGHRFWATRQAFERALRETASNGLAVIADDTIWRMAAPVGENHTLGISLKTNVSEEVEIRDRLRSAAAAIADLQH